VTQLSHSPSAPSASGAPLLEVEDLTVTFTRRGRRDVRAVDGVTFSVRPGETVGLVGESGSGKSVTSLALMRLLPSRGVQVGGRATFDGMDLLSLPDDSMRDIRGRDMAMVFQDPMSSLNPVLTVGRQITEVLRRHRGMQGDEARDEAVTLLSRVGIPDPARRFREYPHQLSGGMRQRALIAISLACKPRLLIADEPTTALDVTIQAQILELLRELVVDSGTSLIMITHDLGVVAGLCDSVNVMYSGRVVENASRYELFGHPRHPYTAGLLGSVPRLDAERGQPLRPIPGSPTDTLPWARGCAFQPRCANRIDTCVHETPLLQIDDVRREAIGGPHWLRCFNPVAEGTPLAAPDAPAAGGGASDDARADSRIGQESEPVRRAEENHQ
jgi:peptide/nickel transport system ATP-binding protein